MVVVIAVIAILVAILLPVLAAARKKGKEAATGAMIKNLGDALEHYRADWGNYPIRYNPATPHSGSIFDNGVGNDPGYFQTPCSGSGVTITRPTGGYSLPKTMPPMQNGRPEKMAP